MERKTTCVYVDGENFFIRSQEEWKDRHGCPLEDIKKYQVENRAGGMLRYGLFLHEKGKLFWPVDTLQHFGPRFASDLYVARRVYFTALAGDAAERHNLCMSIRAAGFEPVVVEDRSNLASQRKNMRESYGLLEKAKGVDIELSDLTLKYAYMINYKGCTLFTGDVDFLPVIKAIRRRGKHVAVAAHASGLGKESPLLHVPDEFWDLSEWVAKATKLTGQQ
jgi:uncharacterized LabA/DUF88 family protein